jgi:hypothetical protein
MNIEPLIGNVVKKYIPLFDGEREKAIKDPSYQPLIFHLRPLTEGEAEKYDEFKTRYDPATGQVTVDANPAIDAAIFGAHAIKIENLQVGKKTINNGAEYLTVRDQLPLRFRGLYREILNAVREISLLNEGEIKN